MLLDTISFIWAIAATAGCIVLLLFYKEMAKLAVRDRLTGLLNRHGFQEQAGRFVDIVVSSKEGLRRALVAVKDFSLIFLDVDHFKEVNDRYGHACGDEVLRLLAHILTDSVREVDFVSRWGGEEFVIGLVGADAAAAAEKAERIRSRVADSVLAWRGRQVRFTISCGVAGINGARTLEELVQRADNALYRAKDEGRNRVAVYHES